MNIREVCKKYKLPQEIAQILEQDGIKELFPPQKSALKAGVLNGRNLVLSLPTAAGKTLVAELCMLKSILNDRQCRCLYVVPLRALASEKYEDLKNKYEKLAIKIGISTGDFDTNSEALAKYQILVATSEKVDSLLRFRARWLTDFLKVLVLDEIHLLGDESRGPTLEILTARIKQLNPNVQILGLSATIHNASEIAKWLKAELVVSSWRPVPLKEGIMHNDRVTFSDGKVKFIPKEASEDLTNLVINILKDNGQVLVFVNSRRSTQAAALLLSKQIVKFLSAGEKKELDLISKEISGSQEESTKISYKLSELIKMGVAFHHAGLLYRQRKFVEDNFKNNLIKIICSTPTLAAGVNLPARCVILRDIKRYEAGLGSSFIPTFEYKQCAGRAGRPKYDKFGEAVLIAKTASEMKMLFCRYINAEPEPIISKLNNESALRFHILSSIASGYVYDTKGIFNFLSHTFLSFQKRTQNLIEIVTEVLEFLEKENLVERQGFRFFATTFGSCVSRLYIDPLSGIIIRNGLNKSKVNNLTSSLCFLQLICNCPDMGLLAVNKKDRAWLEEFIACNSQYLLIPPDDIAQHEDYLKYFAEIKTAAMLESWIREEKEDLICDNFGIGPGDIRRHIETAKWLLYSSSVIGELFHKKDLVFQLEALRKRVVYGIKEELLELVSLKGIGRVRARNLFRKGYKKISDLKFASVGDLAKINQIGEKIAKNILEQISLRGFKKGFRVKS
ncbi:MAG: DEAD/DEAH box helicase [Candidatus Omnitrophota bacterium]|nr:DEAD/DEAH box helicase [Candidatus Omnitrophota bacterium]